MLSTLQGSGLACARCGGALTAADDPRLLRCQHCGCTHQHSEDEAVAAVAPAQRLGRRRALRRLGEGLRERGVKGHAVEEARLSWLPFWQVEGKLVGWQRYRLRASSPGDEEEGAPPAPERSVEETVGRDVHYSLAACDTRSYGLLGVAESARRLPLRPFSLQDLPRDQIACSPLTPPAVALRVARLYHSSRLLPTGATGARQRLSILRPRLTLLYYPVWRLHYRVGGRPFEAVLEGVHGNAVRGGVLAAGADHASSWLAAATAGGFLGGVHPLLGVPAWTLWLLWRGRRTGPSGGVRRWGSWLSEELGGSSSRVERLEA